MKLKTTLVFAAALLAASFGAHAAPADETAPYGKRLTSTEAVAKSSAGSFDVYIDAPTGFAYVNTPSGWKFTRKVQDDVAIASKANPEKCAETLASY
ncbi:MAG: hypothetical protein Q7J47_15385 [Azoarcus sp.]|nr:hypothetical protein [Azoarcus sp.]PKO54988.1 MAG: hypothetical protein CVU28_07980 [Betaproteobacteria bacterium HGW-Betaproteobacteria-21]